MDNLETLAGRIDALGTALLRLTAELECSRLIDGSRVSQAWRAPRLPHGATQSLLQAARQTLDDLADQLDDARQARLLRQSLGHQS